MKTRIMVYSIVLGAAVGCSSSDSPSVAMAVQAVSPTGELAVAHAPSIAPPEKAPASEPPAAAPKGEAEASPETTGEDAKSAESQAVTQTLDISALFAPPREAPIVKPPEFTPPPMPTAVTLEKPAGAIKPPPSMRLIGFTESDTLRALLSVDGKLNLLAEGDSVEGVDVLALAPPLVTLKHGDNEIEINLIDQPWSEGSAPPNEPLRPGMSPSRPLKLPGIPPSRAVPTPPTKTPSFTKEGKNWAAAPAPPGFPPIPGK